MLALILSIVIRFLLLTSSSKAIRHSSNSNKAGSRPKKTKLAPETETIGDCAGSGSGELLKSENGGICIHARSKVTLDFDAYANEVPLNYKELVNVDDEEVNKDSTGSQKKNMFISRAEATISNELAFCAEFRISKRNDDTFADSQVKTAEDSMKVKLTLEDEEEHKMTKVCLDSQDMK